MANQCPCWVTVRSVQMLGTEEPQEQGPSPAAALHPASVTPLPTLWPLLRCSCGKDRQVEAAECTLLRANPRKEQPRGKLDVEDGECHRKVDKVLWLKKSLQTWSKSAQAQCLNWPLPYGDSGALWLTISLHAIYPHPALPSISSVMQLTPLQITPQLYTSAACQHLPGALTRPARNEKLSLLASTQQVRRPLAQLLGDATDLVVGESNKHGGLTGRGLAAKTTYMQTDDHAKRWKIHLRGYYRPHMHANEEDTITIKSLQSLFFFVLS